jgi:ORF6N domain
MSSANFRKSRDHCSSHQKLVTAPLLHFPADTLPSLHPSECFKARGLARFLSDLIFQLDEEEFAALRLQIATLKPESSTGRGQRRKYAPYVFTEHGAIMEATLLNSQRATEISVHVVRAFVEWRAMLANNRELANTLHLLERKVTKHDQAIGELIDSVRQLLAVPEPHKRPIGCITPDKTPQPKALKVTQTEKTAALSKVVRKK